MNDQVTHLQILLVGNPNAGKTTLFNRLTGGSARTGNYPGITVEKRTGLLKSASGAVADVCDLPGTYSLIGDSPEEQLAARELFAASPNSLVVIVADANVLSRHLYLAVCVAELHARCILALNFKDEAEAQGTIPDTQALEKILGIPTVLLSSRSGEGLADLERAISNSIEGPALRIEYPARIESFLPQADAHGRAKELLRLLSPSESQSESYDEKSNQSLGHDIVQSRYQLVDRAVQAAYASTPSANKSAKEQASRAAKQDRIDNLLTHPILGTTIFLLIMALLFQSLFAWSEPAMSSIEQIVAWAQGGVRALLPKSIFADLVAEGVLGGVGNVLVFVPQIALLSAFIVVLEDCGYLARVAFLVDRMMRSLGLHGKAFVPLLSGFACAVPAIMSTRTISNRRDRFATMMALPLMSCSARLPVYALLAALIFPASATYFGFLHKGSVALFAMYLLGTIGALAAVFAFRRTVLKGPVPPLVLELPPYRMPSWSGVLKQVLSRVKTFVVEAGTVILAITIVLFGLLNFPRDASREAAHQAAVASANVEADSPEKDARIAALESEYQEQLMSNSAAGTAGRMIEPLIAPLGFDWRIGIGLLGSFAAREVLVSTLSVAYGSGADQDENSDSLRERLQNAERPNGTRVFTPLTSLSLMVFFVFAAQCMSTLAVVKRETQSWRWPLFMLVYMNVLAYLASLLVYQGGRLLGFQ